MKPFMLYCVCYPIMLLILYTGISESFEFNSLFELGWKVLLCMGILLVIFQFSEKLRNDIKNDPRY